ncbi:MAG: glycosyltransferase family 4 protein [Chloroflexi bacterium OHK40]
MRIALIVPGGVGQDGVHLVIPALLDLIGELATRHELLVAALEQGDAPTSYELRGARVVCLGRASLGRRLARLLGGLRGFQPQLLHSFWLGTTSTLGLLAGATLGVPLVASLGGGELVRLPQIGYGGRLSARQRAHTALALGRSHVVTAGSRYALGPLLARRRDARLVPLGAALVDGATAARPPGPPWQLLTVASINRVKGPEVLLRALALARGELRARTGCAEPFTLDWVGQDVLDGTAHRLAAGLGLGKAVRFHGWRPHSEALALARRAHLYLQASYHESQGVAVCEAASAATPTVGTAVGLVAELAPEAAVAVPPGDPAALGRAIVMTLTDPPCREALGRSARQWARAHDAAWTARQFEQLYGTPR